MPMLFTIEKKGRKIKKKFISNKRMDLWINSENALAVLERKVLRDIFGIKLEGDQFRSMSNAELCHLFTSVDVFRRLKVNRLR